MYLPLPLFSSDSLFPVPAEKKNPHSMILPLPYFMIEMVCLGLQCQFSDMHGIVHESRKEKLDLYD